MIMVTLLLSSQNAKMVKTDFLNWNSGLYSYFLELKSEKLLFIVHCYCSLCFFYLYKGGCPLC